jgi:DNA polymerase-3 subunit delta'
MSIPIGHEARWAALARAFQNGTIPQTLLISGPPHIGKRTFTRRYAQLLLCESPLEENALPAPCGECRACHQVEVETFPDFRTFRPLVSSVEDEKDWIVAPTVMQGSVIPIGMARKFANEAMKKPLVGARKVMIVAQADRMTDDAQNCLLKTFEEPIPGLSIFLICDNADHLRATIRSRCWHLPLGLASDAQITDWLRASTPATVQHIALAVRAAAGRPGAALREIQRLQNCEAAQTPSTPRMAQAEEFVDRITRARPVGALGLTEEALRLAKLWWEEDIALEASTPRGEVKKSDLKKSDAKITRTATARFLDELIIAYRARWQAHLQSGSQAGYSGRGGARWSDGLDQIRKTRHYILRNANANLALDVLFGRLVTPRS